MSPRPSESSFIQIRLKSLLKYMDTYHVQFFILIVILALGLGVGILAIRPLSLNNGQTGAYWEIARNLINGQGYSLCQHSYFPFCGFSNQTTASREPAPVLLLALTTLLFPNVLLNATLLQLAIYVGITLALYILTKHWAGKHAALLASLIWAVYLPGLKLVSQFSGDLLATLGITLGIYYILRAQQTNHDRDWVLAGLALGLAIMSRSASLVVALVVVSGSFVAQWLRQKNWLASLKSATLISIPIVILMLSWAARNQMALGSPVIGSTLTGYNIYRHNYMLGTSDYFRYVGSSEGYLAIQNLLARHPNLTGLENEVQMDAIYRQEGLKIILAHPMQYLYLSAFRFLPLWLDWRVSEAYGTPTSTMDYMVMIEQFVLLAAAIFAARQALKNLWPIWLSVLGICLAYMLVDSQLRYLVPVMPLVVSLAAASLIKFFETA